MLRNASSLPDAHAPSERGVSGLLVRNRADRIVAGVAAGLGDLLGVDRVVVRLAFVVLSFAGGVGVVAYLLLWLLSGIVTIGAAASAAAYVELREEMDELFDRELRQIALTLRDQKDFDVNTFAGHEPEEEDAFGAGIMD